MLTRTPPRLNHAPVQAQVALQALLPEGGGLSSDYAGVIDVLEVLQSVLDDESLLALGCFRCVVGCARLRAWGSTRG